MPRAGRNTKPSISLRAAIDKLAPLYPMGKPLSDPLAILVWENVGYLIDDARRAELFAEFKKRIGLEAHEIANAPMPVLTDIAGRGGMHPQKRAERLREIGALAISQCDGDVPSALRALPLAKARALLKKFPSVGDPGADRILLFTGVAARPSVESNGLRALVRLGFVAEQKSYAQTYKAATGVLLRECGSDAGGLQRAYVVLREHGKALCKRAAPICEPCPLDRACAHRPVTSPM
jgi:endonuclease-3